jgi:hypothetical protein
MMGKEGLPFECFAGRVEVSYVTLYAWCKRHPAFLKAKQIGQAKLLEYDMQVMKAGIQGQLRRVSRETPVLDEKGRPTYDAQGKLVVIREYAPATYGQHAHKYRLGNVHRWKERIAEAEDSDAPAGMTDEEVTAALSDPKMEEMADRIAREIVERTKK